MVVINVIAWKGSAARTVMVSVGISDFIMIFIGNHTGKFLTTEKLNVKIGNEVFPYQEIGLGSSAESFRSLVSAF